MTMNARICCPLLFLSGLVAGCDAADAPKLNIGLSPAFFDEHTDESSRAVWLIYAQSRMTYAEAHAADLVYDGNRVVPTFADELQAREQGVKIYTELKLKKPEYRDAYWSEVKKVADAGYLSEYVWTYLMRPSWKAGHPPTQLDKFAKYQSEHLKNHRPATLAGISKL